jgi:hypothetical protein
MFTPPANTTPLPPLVYDTAGNIVQLDRWLLELALERLHDSQGIIVSESFTWVRGHETHASNPWAKSVAYRRRNLGVCLGRGGGFAVSCSNRHHQKVAV